MRVVVTGAAGFVGRHVCSVLANAGYHVRALVRAPVLHLDQSRMEVAICPDLVDRQAARRAIGSCDMVVHLAGRAHVLRERALDPRGEFRRANVEATRCCLDAALAGGARQFLFVSSLSAVAGNNAGLIDEAFSPSPRTLYGASKLEAEALVAQYASRTPITATILRPPMIYGEHMRGNPLRLFALVERGLPLPFGAVRNRRSVLYVGNLAMAIYRLLEPKHSAATYYYVRDANDLSTATLIGEIGRALGRPARLIPVPEPILNRTLNGMTHIARALRLPLSTAAVEGLYGSLYVDDSRLRVDTNFTPISAEEGLGRTAAWFVAEWRERNGDARN